MRQVGGCALCASAYPTAGELLAYHIGATIDLIHNSSVNSTDSPIYIWNDMFDPYHNSQDYYYFVPTSLAGSYKGIPCGTNVFNWNLGKLSNSLNFFAGLNLSQIVAGYYD